MATKRITQETFDEVVKENIDEFDMTSEEALSEAIQQFESQGRLCPNPGQDRNGIKINLINAVHYQCDSDLTTEKHMYIIVLHKIIFQVLQ